MDTLLLGCLLGRPTAKTEYRDGPVWTARRPSRPGKASFARSPVSHRLRGLRVIAGIPGPASAQPGSAVPCQANGAKFVSRLLPPLWCRVRWAGKARCGGPGNRSGQVLQPGEGGAEPFHITFRAGYLVQACLVEYMAGRRRLLAQRLPEADPGVPRGHGGGLDQRISVLP